MPVEELMWHVEKLSQKIKDENEAREKAMSKFNRRG